jgi:hypothetical protein
MHTYHLENDLSLLCVKAESFPHDIKKAFDQLVALISGIEGRTFFGISYQLPSDEIIYKAAALELTEGEGEKLGCETYLLKKGKYICETLHNWMKDPSSIGACFKKMIDTRTDTVFPCVEWYKGPDVKCMVRLDQDKK